MRLWREGNQRYEPPVGVSMSEPLVADRLSIIHLSGLTPTDDQFDSYDAYPPKFAAFAKRAEMLMEDSDHLYPVNTFNHGARDGVIKRIIDHGKAILGADFQRTLSNGKPPRFYVATTRSVENCLRNYEQHCKEPLRYISRDAHQLGDYLFHANIFDAEGQVLPFDTIKDRLGNVKLYAVSMGNSWMLELENKLCGLLAQAGFDAQQIDELTQRVSVVGISPLTPHLFSHVDRANGKAVERNAEMRVGFSKAFYESTEDKYVKALNCREHAPHLDDLSVPQITRLPGNSIHVLGYAPKTRMIVDPTAPSWYVKEVKDELRHRPTIMTSLDASAVSEQDTLVNTIPWMTRNHFNAIVSEQGAPDMHAYCTQHAGRYAKACAALR
jgi:hypothetical protein